MGAECMPTDRNTFCGDRCVTRILRFAKARVMTVFDFFFGRPLKALAFLISKSGFNQTAAGVYGAMDPCHRLRHILRR